MKNILFKHGVSRSNFSRSYTEFFIMNSVLLREINSFYSVLKNNFENQFESVRFFL